MSFIFFPLIVFSSDPCSNFSTSCEDCFYYSTVCGWCKDNKRCILNNDTVFLSTCVDWTDKFDIKCHLESVKPLPLGTRIGVGIFSGLIALASIIFWTCVYPICLNRNQKKIISEGVDPFPTQSQEKISNPA